MQVSGVNLSHHATYLSVHILGKDGSNHIITYRLTSQNMCN